jgi:mycofactocin precursor
MDHEQTSAAGTTGTEAIHTVREGAAVAAAERAEIVDELLIEEISIDGMCGVY